MIRSHRGSPSLMHTESYPVELCGETLSESMMMLSVSIAVNAIKAGQVSQCGITEQPKRAAIKQSLFTQDIPLEAITFIETSY